MLIDPFINGFAEMHDRHRDMRLDVDNMSYEVLQSILRLEFSFMMSIKWENNFKKLSFINIMVCVSGTIGFGRTNRECKHGIE